MKLYRKGLKGKLDKVFSLYIRTRDKWICQKCGKQQQKGSKGYHAAHIEGRRKESTRWDEANCFGMCYGCHFYLDTHPLEKIHWYVSKFGKKMYNGLVKQANQIVKYKDWEIEELIRFYQNNSELKHV